MDDNSSHEAIKNKGVISINSVRNSHLRWGAKRCICVWVGMFLPLFIATFQQSARQAFRSGSIFGLSLAVVSFYWMIPGAERFTGNSVLYGIAAFLISTVFLALWSGLVLSLIGFLRHQNDSVISFLSNAAMVAAIFCVAEFLLSLISQGMPWFDFHAGNAIADNLWAIQPAAFSGVYGLTFIVVLSTI